MPNPAAKKKKTDAKGKKKRPPATLNGALWQGSDAKNMIAQDIIDGHIPPYPTAINVEEIFEELYSGHPYFDNFPFDRTRYRGRIQSLRKAVQKHSGWATFDDQALLHDLGLRPPAARNVRGQLRWDGSEAQRLLPIDIANKKHLEEAFNTPKKLWASNIEYLKFDLNVFRGHIDQCKQALKEFGQTPGQSKKKQRAKKNKLGGAKYKRPTD